MANKTSSSSVFNTLGPATVRVFYPPSNILALLGDNFITSLGGNFSSLLSSNIVTVLDGNVGLSSSLFELIEIPFNDKILIDF